MRRPEQPGAFVYAGATDEGCGVTDRLRPEAQDGPGHDPQRPFGPQKELLQIETGVVLDERAHGRHHRPVCQHGFEAEDYVAHHPVAEDAQAARIGRYGAAHRRRAAGPQIEGKEQAGIPGRILHRFDGGAAARHHRHGQGIGRLDGRHPLSREGDLIGCAENPVHEAGGATPGHDGDARLGAGGHYPAGLFRVPRAHEGEGRTGLGRPRPGRRPGTQLLPGHEAGGPDGGETVKDRG